MKLQKDFYKKELTHESCALLSFLPRNKPLLGIEIGVHLAKTSCILLYRIPKLKMILVDNWKDYPKNNEFAIDKKEALHHLSNFSSDRYRVLHMDSRKAVKLVNNKVDFIFVDASKEYNEYLHDVMKWSKKVKKGGFVFGHDIYSLKGDPNNNVEQILKIVANKFRKEIWINPKRATWLIKL